MVKIRSNNIKDMIKEIYRYMSKTTNMMYYVCLNATVKQVQEIKEYFVTRRVYTLDDVSNCKNIEYCN